jgi:hypothetical protein
MYAVLQEDEVIDYFRDKDSAEAEAFNQFELGNTFSFMLSRSSQTTTVSKYVHHLQRFA